MKECRIANCTKNIPGIAGMGDTTCHGNRSPHTDRCINNSHLEPERVAPDVTGVNGILKDFFYRIGGTAVQATGTENWRAQREVLHRVHLRERICGKKTGFHENRCNCRRG